MSDAKEIAGAVQKYWKIIKVPHDDRTKEVLGQCRSSAIRLGSNNYKYYQRGSGPTVLLIHGYNSNLGSMVPIAESLVEQGFKVVLFDAPAHGESIGTQTTHIEARDLIRKIAQQVGPIHGIVCHSLGLVWALCAWGEEFRAKTLVSIAAPSNYNFIAQKFVELYQIKREIAEGLAKQLEKRFGETLWVDLSPSEILKDICVRGLIVHGQNDHFIPPAHADQLHSSWSKARVEMIEGAGHFDILGVPSVRQLIANHLKELQ